MNYPLKLSFKFFALAPQVYVTDAAGTELCYVKQKLFKFREKVEVFTDSTQKILLSTIQADRVIDFNANYAFRTAEGAPIGTVRRRGLRSIWRAHYEIVDTSGQVAFEIREENPWTKVMDGFFGEIPVLGIFTGMLFHPRYAITHNGAPVMRMSKVSSFLGREFKIEKLTDIPPQAELPIVMSLLMFVLLERTRG